MKKIQRIYLIWQIQALKSYSQIYLTLHFSVEGIRQLLSNLDTNEASGPDEIPSFILKQFAVEISPILQVIFTKSLSSGLLPSDWKKQTFVQSLRKVGVMKQVIIDRYLLLLYAQKQWNTSFFTT